MSDGTASFDPLARGDSIDRRKCLLFAVPVLQADLAVLREVVRPPVTAPPCHNLPERFPALECAIGVIERSADDEASPEEEQQARETLQVCLEAAVLDQEFEIAAYFRDIRDILVRRPDDSGRPPHHVQTARTLRSGELAGALTVRTDLRNRTEQKAIREATAVQRALYEDYLEEVCGPVPAVACAPEWRTDTAVLLARSIYESRDFSVMPILADALQDAGCEIEEVLNHCRDTSQVHVRGCWVCDLVLAKDDGARREVR
jgi:hypothetical protein